MSRKPCAGGGDGASSEELGADAATSAVARGLTAAATPWAPVRAARA